jgi:hypothetical protein
MIETQQPDYNESESSQAGLTDRRNNTRDSGYHSYLPDTIDPTVFDAPTSGYLWVREDLMMLDRTETYQLRTPRTPWMALQKLTSTLRLAWGISRWTLSYLGQILL